MAAPTATGHPDITDNPGSARLGELATVEYAISPVTPDTAATVYVQTGQKATLVYTGALQ
jgi:hypothetical protein